MCTMDLHAIETRCLTYFCRGRETFHDVFDLIGCQLTRHCRAGEVQGHWAGCDRGVPECERVGLAPGMIELNPDRDTGILGGLGPSRQCVQVALVFDDDIA